MFSKNTVVTFEEIEAVRLRIESALDTVEKRVNGTTDEGTRNDIVLLLNVLEDMAYIVERQRCELQNIKNRPIVSAFP